VTVPKNYYYYF